MASNEYERHPRATVNRLKDRGKYDEDTIHSIIDSIPILHVSFSPSADDPFPAILPMLGCTGAFDESLAANAQPGLEVTEHDTQTTPGSFPTDDKKSLIPFQPGRRDIYLHGHAASRLFKTSKDGTIPLCIAATSMQGVVLSLTPFHNSCNYTSAVVMGYGSLVSSEAERMYALTRITDNLVPSRWDNSRVPPTKAELTTTGVIKVNIVSASAKIRVGGPSDDRADLKNEEVIGNVWTGIVPCWTEFGTPVPSSYNKVQTLPGYLEDWIKEKNESGSVGAVHATKPATK